MHQLLGSKFAALHLVVQLGDAGFRVILRLAAACREQ